MYRLFLDEDLQYSCAYFRTPDDTLDDAQRNKKQHLIAKLNLKPGQRVLDIAELSGIYDETFRRIWEFYLAGSEMSFRYHGFIVFQAQLSRSIDAVPVTRASMVDAERLLSLEGRETAPAHGSLLMQ